MYSFTPAFQLKTSSYFGEIFGVLFFLFCTRLNIQADILSVFGHMDLYNFIAFYSRLVS